MISEGSSQTATGTQTGNNIAGSFSLSESATNYYSLTEIATDFTLTENGILSSINTKTGNTVDGNYSQSITVNDAYTMIETGTNTGGGFSESVTGNDTATLTESGNPSTGTFTRSIVGTGTYTLNDSGPGATLANVPSGAISYTFAETGDALGAVFSQTRTGQDRYDLLEHFTDVSNTGNGNTPGNMNFLPFGKAFVDPNESPELYSAPTNPIFYGGRSRFVPPQPNRKESGFDYLRRVVIDLNAWLSNLEDNHPLLINQISQLEEDMRVFRMNNSNYFKVLPGFLWVKIYDKSRTQGGSPACATSIFSTGCCA